MEDTIEEIDPKPPLLTPDELYEHIKQWRIDLVEVHNSVIAGRSPLDQSVMIERIQYLEQDVRQLLAYCELLAKLHLEPQPATDITPEP